jgi:hypothetical protein
VLNGTLGNNYAGNYVENAVTVTWSGKNLATGFAFTSNPGTLATSSFDGGFAELGHERNGSFFSGGDPDLAAASPQAPVSQTLTMGQLQPVLQNAIAGWQAAGNPAPAALSVSYDSPQPARLDARSQNSGAILSPTPQAQAAYTKLLDQVLAEVAAHPFDPSVFNDPLVPYSG